MVKAYVTRTVDHSTKRLRIWPLFQRVVPAKALLRNVALHNNHKAVEGIPNLQKWMKKHLVAQETAAIKDDWAWWQWHKEQAIAGKLLTVVPTVKQLFFDDNIDQNDARIVDCRDTSGNPIPPELSINKLCTKVNPVEALDRKSVV